MTNVKQLASTDKEAVHNDVLSIYPNWNGERQTLSLTKDFAIIEPPELVDGEIVGEYNPEPSPSGYKLHICPIGDRVLTQAEYTEEGDLITEPTYAGETRIDIVYIEGFQFPALATEVFPINPDSKYSI